VGRRLGETPLQTPPRSADRARSRARVSQKREYFLCGRDYRCFALRLCKLEHGDIETESQFAKSRNRRALIGIADQHSLVERVTGWLATQC
jgi:hypothetical protein